MPAEGETAINLPAAGETASSQAPAINSLGTAQGELDFGASVSASSSVSETGASVPQNPLPGPMNYESAGGSQAEESGTQWKPQDFLQEVAIRAENKIGGTGAVAGTQKHTYAAALINRYQSLYGPVGGGLSTEQSYLAGRYLGQYVNLSGSVRLDVVEGAVRSPSAVFDFKFTINPNPVLSPTRINSIRANAGLGPNVPITVIHP